MMLKSLIWFALAALLEIGGCYCFWMWLRLQRDWLWAVPGAVMLILFALALTRVNTPFAGRAFAAYGGIYIIASVTWLTVVEKTRPLASDWMGMTLCLAGAVIILLGPRWLELNP